MSRSLRLQGKAEVGIPGLHPGAGLWGMSPSLTLLYFNPIPPHGNYGPTSLEVLGWPQIWGLCSSVSTVRQSLTHAIGKMGRHRPVLHK